MALTAAAILLLASVLQTVAATVGGPCREWYSCHDGGWQCISEDIYQQIHLYPPPECPHVEAEPPTSPPGHCRLVNGTCQYTVSSLECRGGYTCTSPFCESTSTIRDEEPICPGMDNTLPPLKHSCLPINDSCQWFNPCRAWRGHCLSPYQCGTLSKYYRFQYGPIPGCALPPEGWVEPVPPGECVVTSDGECGWSNCTAYMDWCQTSWTCGTRHDYALHLASPVPPCAPPPPELTPPPQPGPCLFSVQDQRCQFQPETTPTQTPPTPSPSPGTCSQGQEYTSCGSTCPLTCSNHASPPVCVAVCVERCQCPQGTVWDDVNSQGCIPPDQCCPVTKEPSLPSTTTVEVIADDVCILGLLECPEHHICVPDSTSPRGGACLRSCADENGGCGENLVCVMLPYCEDCGIKSMAGVCTDISGLGGDDGVSTTTEEDIKYPSLNVFVRVGFSILALIVGVVVLVVVFRCYRLHRHHRLLMQPPTSPAEKALVNEYAKDCELSMDNVSDSSFQKEDLSVAYTTSPKEKEDNDTIMT